MADYSASIEIDARPEEVFDYLVTDAGMTAWMGTHARVDPRPGGRFAVDIAGYPVRGEYVVVEPPHRVVFTWGFSGNQELPPGASTVTLELTPTPRGTRVELTHSDLPDPQLAGHTAGWSNFMPRLQVAATGGKPGPDSWRPE